MQQVKRVELHQEICMFLPTENRELNELSTTSKACMFDVSVFKRHSAFSYNVNMTALPSENIDLARSESNFQAHVYMAKKCIF